MRRLVLTFVSVVLYLALVGILAGLIYVLLVRCLGLTDRQLIALFLAVLILDVVLTRNRARWRKPDGQEKEK